MIANRVPAIEVVAAVNDEAVLQANLLRSPLLQRGEAAFRAQRGWASASAAFVDAMAAGAAELVVFAHQDVYLPEGWEVGLRRAIAGLDDSDPEWAVLGVYGVTRAGRQVGQVWSSGLGRAFGEPPATPVCVDALDEVLLVLRRSAGVRFDPGLPGFHLYGTDIVQSAIARGRSAHVIAAPVVHNSRPSPFLGADYFRAYRHLARKWRDRLPIANHVAPLLPPGAARLALRTRHWLLAQRHALAAGPVRVDRGLDCVHIARQLGWE